MKTNTSAFESIADRLKRTEEFVREVGRIAVQDPALAMQIRDALIEAMPPKNGRPEISAAVTVRRTNYHRLCEHFRRNNNALQTVEQIASETSIAPDSVRFVFYKSHTEKFRRRPNPKGGRMKVWQMKSEHLGELGGEAK